jgi:hypothetical protein
MKSSIVKNYINDLRELLDNKSPLVHAIKNTKLLFEALEDLDRMIDMESVKKSIIIQLQKLIIDQLMPKKDKLNTTISNNDLQQNKISTKNPFNGHMLHTVIYGPPGVGKTEIGIILAKFWMSLGIIKISEEEDKNITNVIKNMETPVIIFNTMVEKKLEMIKKTNESINDCIKDIQQILINQHQGFNEVYDQLNPLKLQQSFHSKEHENITFMLVDKLKEDSTKILNIINKNLLCHSPEIFEGDPSDIKKNTKLFFPKKNDQIPVKIVSRPDFVAEYMGQSGPKTRNLLNENRGKVLIIDEAYTLYLGEKDQYGAEALAEINRFMSEPPIDIILIWCGYYEAMKDSIFKIQKGLVRRCMWRFHIESYTASAMSQIFKSQLEEEGWSISPDINLLKFFETNKLMFQSYGGDTRRFVYYLSLSYNQYQYNEISSLIKQKSKFEYNSLNEKDKSLNDHKLINEHKSLNDHKLINEHKSLYEHKSLNDYGTVYGFTMDPIYNNNSESFLNSTNVSNINKSQSNLKKSSPDSHTPESDIEYSYDSDNVSDSSSICNSSSTIEKSSIDNITISNSNTTIAANNSNTIITNNTNNTTTTDTNNTTSTTTTTTNNTTNNTNPSIGLNIKSVNRHIINSNITSNQQIPIRPFQSILPSIPSSSFPSSSFISSTTTSQSSLSSSSSSSLSSSLPSFLSSSLSSSLPSSSLQSSLTKSLNREDLLNNKVNLSNKIKLNLINNDNNDNGGNESKYSSEFKNWEEKVVNKIITPKIFEGGFELYKDNLVTSKDEFDHDKPYNSMYT